MPRGKKNQSQPEVTNHELETPVQEQNLDIEVASGSGSVLISNAQDDRLNEESEAELSDFNQLKLLKMHIARLHGLAGLRGVDSHKIFSVIKRLNPISDELPTLYETIQAKGLVMYDNETTITVPITRIAKIKGTPLWKENILKEYENDTDATGVVSEWINFIMPVAETE